MCLGVLGVLGGANDRKSAPLKGEMLSKFSKMVPDIPYRWMAEVVRRITGSAKKETHICYKSAYLKGEMLSNF